MISKKEIICPENLLRLAKSKGPVKAVIVNAVKLTAIESAKQAVDANLITPIFIGDKSINEENAKQIKKILLKENSRLTEIEKRLLGGCLDSHVRLGVAYHFREKLTNLYGLRTTDASSVIPHINEWCESAEKTRIAALRDFSVMLKSYGFLA